MEQLCKRVQLRSSVPISAASDSFCLRTPTKLETVIVDEHGDGERDKTSSVEFIRVAIASMA